MSGETANFHARYLYRDYLQVAECDLTGETPALVRSYLWDPSEPEATRVLAMTRWEANGTQVKEHLYCMHDAMKNVTSLFGEARGRRALYEYRPYGGLVTSEGNMAQENKFRFSCEYMDDETRDKVLKAAYDLADKSALADHSDGQYEVSTKWMAQADDAEAQGIEPWEYVLFHTAYNEMEGTKDADGKTVKGEAKSDHVREWLEDFSGLTDEQRAFLWGTVYTSEW